MKCDHTFKLIDVAICTKCHYEFRGNIQTMKIFRISKRRLSFYERRNRNSCWCCGKTLRKGDIVVTKKTNNKVRIYLLNHYIKLLR